jgi:hypothetical protein
MTQEPTSWVRSAPALSGITLLPGRSELLNHLPLDSSLQLPSKAHFILADSWPELNYSASWSVSRSGQLRERHAFNMNRKGSKNRSLSGTDRVTANRQASARSLVQLMQVLFHDSKYSQPCHMYISIACRWQEITWLLPLKAGLSNLLDPELHRIHGNNIWSMIGYQCNKCLHPTPKT